MNEPHCQGREGDVAASDMQTIAEVSVGAHAINDATGVQMHR